MTHNFVELQEAKRIKEVIATLEKGNKQNLSNVKDSLKGFLAWSIFYATKKNLLYIAPTDRLAQKKARELEALMGDLVLYFPLEPIHAYFSDAHSNEISYAQVRVIYELLFSDTPHVIVASGDALLRKVLPPEKQKLRYYPLETGDQIEPEDLVHMLLNLGYVGAEQVEHPGQFAQRGGIIDVFSVMEENPWRLDFFDNEIESIFTFGVENQRSIAKTEKILIPPTHKNTLDQTQREQAFQSIQDQEDGEEFAELIEKITQEVYGHDISLFAYTEEKASLLDYFGDMRILIDEQRYINETCEIFLNRGLKDILGLVEERLLLPQEKNQFFSVDELEERVHQEAYVSTYLFSDGIEEDQMDMKSKEIESFSNQPEQFCQALQNWMREGYQIFLCCKSTKTIENMKRYLNDLEMDKGLSQSHIHFIEGEIGQGFELPVEGLVYINESEVFKTQQRSKGKRKSKANKIERFTQLNFGDYVVHDIHGIGIYRGIEQVKISGLTKDLMVIEYQNDAKFYLPVEQMDLVSVYIGTGGDRKPRLSQLGRPDWAKTKSKAKKAVEEMTEELIALYAKRRQLKGYAYGQDTTWQKEFEEAFPYDETDDQLRSVEEIKGDMESIVPMDRLLCGDVGYGKTEVALRAAFKAIMEGKQVAILVPTTILASQHYHSIAERFSNYPVTVESMSRFKRPKEQKIILENLAIGQVDLIVGTHRLLSKDVQFKDLGLLIVDEEQRFGVRAKEKIKELKKNVDVLTLSATPIPRTLHMSMTGIRDMSVIEEPPPGRRPVQTYVMPYNPIVIGDAIDRELGRGGQVYFVHNRVQDIYEIGGEIQALVPDARIVVAHGQMSGKELESIMEDFFEHQFDVLVATTIIESGLDISNANTMIIDQGDRFGLAQLYQLKGRVGRSKRQGYCYVTHKRQIPSETAQKRLKAIKDFTAFGSGFKIAMRDLEIRGAGNLLGASQSGHMMNVGYEMYCRILEEAMTQKMDGKTPEEKPETVKINLNVDGFVPENYISSEALKFEIYKKISYVHNEERYKELQEELFDRFGVVPKGILNLMGIAIMKHRAESLNIIEIRQWKDSIRFYFNPAKSIIAPSLAQIPLLYEKYHLKFKPIKNREDVWSIQLNSDQIEIQLKEINGFLKRL